MERNNLRTMISAISPLIACLLVLAGLVALAGLIWICCTSTYVPPPTVHRDYTRPGDPEEKE